MAILATPEPGRLVLVRQYRHAIGGLLWEIPAGTAEHGEDPLDGARRELREETGYRSAEVTRIGSFYTSPGFCDEIVHLYHAQRLEPGPQALDGDERIEVGTFSLEAAWRLVGGGGVADCKTVVALLWLKNGCLAF
jgi:ADP-ribose pyrophosphatase